MSGSVDLLRRLAAVEQRAGQIYDQVYCTYVPLTTALAEIGGGLIGGALNVGTYTVGPVGGGATYSFNYPTTAKSIKVVLSGRWGAANNGYYCGLIPNGRTTAELMPAIVAQVANIQSIDCGDCNLDSSGRAQLLVGGANMTGVTVRIMGYFL
jgi:hypothetical protein